MMRGRTGRRHERMTEVVDSKAVIVKLWSQKKPSIPIRC